MKFLLTICCFIALGFPNKAFPSKNPFSPLLIAPKVKPGQRSITDYFLYEFTLTAIAWNPEKSVALFAANDGQTFLVKEGSKIGKKGGKILKIDAKMIIVEEPFGKKIFELKGN